MGFVGDKVPLRKIFHRVFGFYPVSIISPMLHTHSVSYQRRYVMLAIESVFKQGTVKTLQRGRNFCMMWKPYEYKWVNGMGSFKTLTLGAGISFKILAHPVYKM